MARSRSDLPIALASLVLLGAAMLPVPLQAGASTTAPVVAAADTPLIVRHASPELSISRPGQAVVYTLSLQRSPDSDVVIGVEASRSLRTNRRTVRFTPSNWSIPQAVLVSSSNSSSGGAKRTAFIRHRFTTAPSDWKSASSPALMVRFGTPGRAAAVYKPSLHVSARD